MKKILALCLVVGSLCAAGAAWADKPAQLRFMAGPPGGNWFALGGALADTWTNAGLPTTSITGGAIANIINANNRKGELGFSNTSMVAVAQKGNIAPFTDAMENVSIMANLYTQYTYFIARKDFVERHNIKSVDDLVARKIPTRFATLKTGTGSEFYVNALFTAGFGLDYRTAFKDWGGTIEYASYSGGADLIADGHIDLFSFAVGKVASIVMQIESQTDVVILPLEQETLDKVADVFGTTTFTVDPGIYKSVTEEPVKVIGDYTCIVVRNDLDDDVVYDLCKVMLQEQDALAKGVIDIAELDPKTAAATPPTTTHPGAAKFWAEAAAE